MLNARPICGIDIMDIDAARDTALGSRVKVTGPQLTSNVRLLVEEVLSNVPASFRVTGDLVT